MSLPVISTPAVAARSENPPGPLMLGRAFLLGMVLLLFVGYLAYCLLNFGLHGFEDADATRAKERAKILTDRRAEDAKWLNDAPSWFSKDKGQIRVPIEDAKRMAVEQLKGVTPHPGAPLVVAPPQPSSAPTSPDKGQGVPPGTVNPSASNPTLSAPTPAPAPTPGYVPAAAANPTPAAAVTPTPAP